MRKLRFDIALVLTMVAASASTAWGAQKPATARAGEQVIVTQSGSGEELHGRLLELSPTSMAMLVNGERVDVPIENVLRIDVRGDSLKNGAIIGAAILGGMSALAWAEIRNAGGCASMLTINTGIGALAGAGVDAMIKGRTPIYVKAGKSEKAVGLTLRF